MQGSDSFKEALLNHMLVGLQVGGTSIGSHGNRPVAKSMSLLERKDAIKVSADAAMATARGGGTMWSRSLITGLYKRGNHGHVLGEKPATRQCHRPTSKILKSRKIWRRRLKAQGRGWKGAPVSARTIPTRCLARTIVRKRVDVLKRLVPGGTAVNDELSFLGETIDYIVSLRAQVDVMRRLADAVDYLFGGRDGVQAKGQES